MNALTDDAVKRMAAAICDHIVSRHMTDPGFSVFTYNDELKKLSLWTREQLDALRKRG
jgi:hypothetical protein